jgi:hypothetical protein
VKSSWVENRVLRGTALVVLTVGTFLLILGTLLLSTPLPGTLVFFAVMGVFLAAYRWNLHHDVGFLTAWVGFALGVAVVSVVTGLGNGLTDEPYFMPAFLRLWPNLYGAQLPLTYYQMGSGLHYSVSYYVYLPVLSLIWIPGLDYRWLCVGLWLATIYAIRRNGAGVVILGNAWVGLFAANGFNDFVPLFVLTLAFVTFRGWKSRAAEILSLGLKQFANLIVFAYHAAKRQWKDALLALVVTVIFLAPFAVLSPGGVWCHALLVQAQPCNGFATGFYSGSAILSHINYVLYPLWIAAIFGPRYVALLRSPHYAACRQEAAALLAHRLERPAVEVPESFVLALVPILRTRDWLARRSHVHDTPPPGPAEGPS